MKSDDVVGRGVAKVVYIPPTPKVRLINLDGKSEKQYVFLPDVEMTEWDYNVIASYVNTRLVK